MTELEEKSLNEQEELKRPSEDSGVSAAGPAGVGGDSSGLGGAASESPGATSSMGDTSSMTGEDSSGSEDKTTVPQKYVAYTVKLPAHQLSALQSIWLELKKLYGSHSPDKSGMIEAAIGAWLKRWDGPEQDKLLQELLEIRENTRKRQYRKKRD